MDVLHEADTQEFIRRLPEITVSPPSVHLLMLAVRSRKAKEMLGVKMKDMVLEKGIVRATQGWRTRYFYDIYNLALLQHNGKYDSKDIMITPQATGLYATIAPRNVVKAVSNLMMENTDYIFQQNESAMYELCKQNSRYFGFLHQHSQKGNNFVDFDIDEDSTELYSKVKDILSPYPKFMSISSSRGYHIIVNLSKETDAAEFYKAKTPEVIKSQTYPSIVEFKRDPQPPIVGSYYSSSVRPEPNYVRIVD